MRRVTLVVAAMQGDELISISHGLSKEGATHVICVMELNEGTEIICSVRISSSKVFFLSSSVDLNDPHLRSSVSMKSAPNSSNPCLKESIST